MKKINLDNQEYLKKQILERKQQEENRAMSDAEYRLNRELLESIKIDPNKTHVTNKIF